jgi:hypothetical protein
MGNAMPCDVQRANLKNRGPAACYAWLRLARSKEQFEIRKMTAPARNSQSSKWQVPRNYPVAEVNNLAATRRQLRQPTLIALKA